ncbi:hypothetical protein B9Z55_022157 [Caenorhabditis nigoni]|uniref:Uncharacterized protein n=1 Tax=Caenorhabditis nigoni TaxID=1611254 RepID=A0A2G5TV04_9PELO|nr:hypothetical protein B9Z55_022157 [Caenorhabditis nigoni]
MPLPQRSQGSQGHQRPQATVTCGYSLQQLRIAVAPNPSHVNGGLRFAQSRRILPSNGEMKFKERRLGPLAHHGPESDVKTTTEEKNDIPKAGVKTTA